MAKTPLITDTQSLYTVIGEIHAKVETLVTGQETLFNITRQNQQDIAVHKEFCGGVQKAKTVKETADEKAQSRRKAIIDAVLIFVIVSAIGITAGAFYTMHVHVTSEKAESVNPDK